MVKEILNRIHNSDKEIYLPNHQYLALSENVDIYFLQKEILPITSIIFSFDVSTKIENEEEAGLLDNLVKLMQMGAGKYDKYQFESYLAYYGIQLDCNINRDKMNISLTTVTEYLDKAMEFFKVMFYEPHFNEEDLKLNIDNTFQMFEHYKIDPNYIPDFILKRVMFKYHQTYKKPLIGYQDTLNNITIDQIKFYHQNYITKAKVQIFCVSDLPLYKLQNLFKDLFNDNSFTNPKINFSKNILRKKLYLVDRQDSIQANILFANYTTQMNEPNYNSKNIMNKILGGDFNSILNSRIREQIGATYGIHSSFNHLNDLSLFTMNTSIENDKLQQSFQILFDEFENFKLNVDDDKIENAKIALYNSLIYKYETYTSVVSHLKSIIQSGIEKIYYNNFKSHIFNVTKNDIIQDAKLHLNDNLVAIIVGNGEIIRNQLKDFNFDIVEVDNEKILSKDLVIE